AGRVIGIDASAATVERARAATQDLAQVDVVHADVNGDHDIAMADLIYSRLFLLHQRDPLATLQRVARLLRSGGALIAHEPSDELAGAPASEPAVPAMTRVWELVIGAARARGAQTDFGRHGRSYIERAGLAIDSHYAYFVHYPPAIGFEIPRVA